MGTTSMMNIRRVFFRQVLLFLLSWAWVANASESCRPEYALSWYNETNVLNDHTFSVSHFQSRIASFYYEKMRPPIMEAYFIVKAPQEYHELWAQECPVLLVMALMLVAEAKLQSSPDEAVAIYNHAVGFSQKILGGIYTIGEPHPWPVNRAGAQFNEKLDRIIALQEERKDQNMLTIDFVVSHCKEKDLDWMADAIGPEVKGKLNARMFIYEKCRERTDLEFLKPYYSEAYSIQRPDPSFVARGDECSAYLTYIRSYYDGGMGDFVFFIHSDPFDHMQAAYLRLILRSMVEKTYEEKFLHLNGPKHVKTITPCLQAIHEEIFGETLKQLVGPYCCAQFVVQREKIQERPKSFFENMLKMVNGTMTHDLCTTSTTARSTHCYGMEFMWHIIFGQPGDPPLRQDDQNLPTGFRLKFQTEEEKYYWEDVMLSPHSTLARGKMEQVDNEFLTLGGINNSTVPPWIGAVDTTLQMRHFNKKVDPTTVSQQATTMVSS